MTRFHHLLLTSVFAVAATVPVAAQTNSYTRAPSRRAVSKAPLRVLTEREANPKGPFATLSAMQRDSIIGNTRELLGTRYKWAGITPEKGLDCSGFVKYVFAKLGIDLPHSAHELAKLGGLVQRDTSDMRPGDLMESRWVALSVANGPFGFESRSDNARNGAFETVLCDGAFADEFVCAPTGTVAATTNTLVSNR